MPVIDQCGEIFQQHLFLGISVKEMSASVGWGQQSSDITITLVEDPCPSAEGKICYDDELTSELVYTADPGFLGENRYERANGTQYSACAPEDGGDTLIRSAIDIVGLPAYFRLGDFEYSGIISDYNRSVSSQGIVYRVKLTDPREILNGVHLILGDYAGAVYQTGNINVYNIYGFAEQFGAPAPSMELTSLCTYTNTVGDTTPDGAIFGTYSGGFGGSFVNENGMPAPMVLQAFNMMANAAPIHSSALPFVGSLDGVNPIPFVSYYGKPLTGPTCGLMPEDDPINHLCYYRVDLSEIPILGGYYNRVQGTVVTLLDLIEQLVSEAGMDYYIELIPVISGSNISKFIKVRVVDRTSSPSANQICSYISSQPNTIDYNIGQELRIETTGAIVVGANKQSVYQACGNTNPDGGDPATLTSIAIDVTGLAWSNLSITGCTEIDDTILPYFGKHRNGDLIVACTGDRGWEFEVDTTELNSTLNLYTVQNPLKITELELRAALSGFDSFQSIVTKYHTPIWIDVFLEVLAMKDLALAANLIAVGANQAARDWLNPRRKCFFKLDASPTGTEEQLKEHDRQLVFSFFQQYAQEYYGKKFAVRVPFTTAWLDYESRKAKIADQPTNDGGWTEATSVIGLPTASAAMNFFRDNVGKILPFVKFSNSGVTGEIDVINITTLDPNNYLLGDDVTNELGAIYVRAEVEEEYVFHDAGLYYGPRVIVTIEDGLYDAHPIPGQEAKLNNLIKDADEDIDAIEKVGGKNAIGTIESPRLLPDAAAIPILSNVISYGPFYYGSTGIPGKVNISKDEYLAPWNYGSFSTMNAAGVYTAAKGISAMKSGELGSITLAGYPRLPLGAELGAVDGGVYPSDEYLLENRSITTTNISDISYSGATINVDYETTELTAGPWSGSYGPNITNISVEISSTGGATTTYTMRSFAPRQRLVERKLLDKIVSNRLESRKMIANKITQALKTGQVSSINKNNQTFRAKQFLDGGWRGELRIPGTPHEVFCGQIVPFIDDINRTLVTTSKMSEISIEMQSGYENKAFMSIDGLLRPVSMDGSGGLPRYIQPLGADNCAIYTGSGCTIGPESQLTQMVIDIDHLNPFSNPADFARSTVVSARSDTPDTGHDIEVVGRTGDDEGTPEHGMIMPLAGMSGDYDADYQDDYRIMAIKGPLLIQQWGYDTEDKPVPNKIDDINDIADGVFESSGLQCKFMDDWLKKPESWPVAPLDLRLDRERGVWVTKSVPDHDDIIIGTACQDVTGDTPFRVLVSWPTFTDCNGSPIASPIVYAVNHTENAIDSGDNVILKKTKNCYIVIESDGTVENGCNVIHRVFPFQVIDNCVEYGQDFMGKEILIDDLGNSTLGTQEYNIHQMAIDAGPAGVGFKGWAVEVIHCSTGEDTGEYPGDLTGEAYLLNIEHYAKYVKVDTIDGSADPLDYWDGRDPGSGIIVEPGCYDTLPSTCYSCAVAVFDPEESTCSSLVYKVIEVDTTVSHSTSSECIVSGTLSGTKFNNYVWAKGMAVYQEDSCTLKIGSYTTVNGTRANEITFNDCFSITPTGSCGVMVSLGSPTTDIALEVVIPPILCISGDIVYDTVIIHTACGMITGIES